MTKPLAIILGGETGLLGQALVEVFTKAHWECLILDRRVCDVLDRTQLEKFIETHNPNIVINAIAYTQVDLAEDNKQEAFAINKNLVQNLGLILAKSPSLLVHFSTDFVFNGLSNKPYCEADNPDPLNVYGASKLAGEQTLEQISSLDYLIIRSSWLFGPYKKNFISTILNKAKELPKLTVVHDQIGSPSYTMDIAEASLNLINCQARGLVHFANSGQASWCEFACEAVKFANLDCNVQAIDSSEYPHKAIRPSYSVLDSQKYKELTKQSPRVWTSALNEYIFQDYLPHN